MIIVKYVTSDWKHEGFFKVSKSMKISDLKERIAEKLQISKTSMLLIFKHKLMKDDHPLSACKIKNGHEIRVIIETKGQKIKKLKKMGPIEGIKVGTRWSKREHVAAAEVHTPWQQGISGDSIQGAVSIILSGGYENDLDFGSVIFYTGAGPRDKFGKPIADQTLTKVNKALAINCRVPLDPSKGAISTNWHKGVPVRVVRKVKKMIRHKTKPNKWKKTEFYRYDGIYKVVAYWRHSEKNGVHVWRYLLLKDGRFDPDKVIDRILRGDTEND